MLRHLRLEFRSWHPLVPRPRGVGPGPGEKATGTLMERGTRRNEVSRALGLTVLPVRPPRPLPRPLRRPVLPRQVPRRLHPGERRRELYLDHECPRAPTSPRKTWDPPWDRGRNPVPIVDRTLNVKREGGGAQVRVQKSGTAEQKKDWEIYVTRERVVGHGLVGRKRGNGRTRTERGHRETRTTNIVSGAGTRVSLGPVVLGRPRYPWVGPDPSGVYPVCPPRPSSFPDPVPALPVLHTTPVDVE